MKTNSNPAQGMRDLLPSDVQLRTYVEKKIIDVYNSFGFTQIETPSIEKINLLTSGEGGDNEKLIFKILKRGDKLNLSNIVKESEIVDLGLRYDLTVPLARFYANNRAKLPSQFKVIQVGNVWRAERPQKGRFRQFRQCDIDIIGVKSILAEIELIVATSKALQELEFTNFKVRINDRRILESFAEYCNFDSTDYGKVFIILDKLDKIGITGVKNELENSGYSASQIDKFINILDKATDCNINNINNLIPNIPQQLIYDINNVISTVSNRSNNKYSIVFDLSLVRGMGYYTGQIFEIEIDGYNYSVAGGGRYDKMIGKILNSKEEIPSCGFSIGFERIVSILEEKNFRIPTKNNKIAILYDKKLDSFVNILSEADKFRKLGNYVSIELRRKNLKKQLNDLQNQGYVSYCFYQENIPIELKELSNKNK